MADFDSSLPIRTENAGDVISKIADANTPSQQLAVEADGSINVNASATDLDIRDLDAAQDNVAISDGTDTLAINNDGSINAVVTATDLDIRDLAFATDKVDVTGSEVSLDATTLAALESITVQNGAGAAAVNIQDGGNSITVDATDLDIRDLDFATDSIDVSGSSVTVTATDLDIRDLTHVTDSVKIGDGTDFLAVNNDGSINSVVTATDLDIRDLDAAQDSVAAHLFDEAGVAFSASNPLPVSLIDGAGTEINNYDTQANLAGGASDNHDYTVPGGNDFLLKRVLATASGKLKIEVQVDTGSGFNTIAVGFNSTATPNIELNFGPVQLAPTNVVRVIRTNRDNQSQDVYSTIIGLILS